MRGEDPVEFQEETEPEMIKKIKICETKGEEIQRRQIIWYGHVRRMEENRIPRMVMQYKMTSTK